MNGSLYHGSCECLTCRLQGRDTTNQNIFVISELLMRILTHHTSYTSTAHLNTSLSEVGFEPGGTRSQTKQCQSDQAIKALFHCKARLLNWYYKYSQTSDDPYSTSKHTYAWSRHFVKDTLFSSRRSVLANAWTPSWPMQYQSRRVDATPSFLEVASTLRVAKQQITPVVAVMQLQD